MLAWLPRKHSNILLFTNWIKQKIYKMSHVYDSYGKFMSFEQVLQFIPNIIILVQSQCFESGIDKSEGR